MTSSAAPPAVTTADLAARLGGTLRGPGDLAITGVESLAEAGPHDITFIADDAHARRWAAAAAGAALVSAHLDAKVPDIPGRAMIVVPDSELALAELLALFAPPVTRPPIGVHPSAVVDPTATIDPGAAIGPLVTIAAGARIAAGVVLHAGVRIYSDVEIDRNTEVHANVVVRERCTIGARVIIHQGVAIGADGFGYRPAASGVGLTKMPHIGTVRIEDDVEIGANTCIDRGKFGATVIGQGSKLDDLVMVGHNVRIGRNVLVAASCAIGGSTEIGDGTMIGGAAAFRDHIVVGPGARVGGFACVVTDVPAGARWGGYPAVEGGEALRQWVAMKRLPDLVKDLRKRSGRDRGASEPPAR